MLGRASGTATTDGGRRALTGRARALLVVGGAVALGGILGVVAEAVTPPPYAATATISPSLYYIGDSAGSVYTFTVKNTGTTSSIGAVEISRPSSGWSMSGCPTPPSGWTAQLADPKCRFRSTASTADDIKPGQSKTFFVKAKTAAGNTDRVGTWNVVVSKSNQFDNTSLLKAATPAGAGLTTTLYTYEVTSAVVSNALVTPGTACPAANTSAVLGSQRTIVVCGKNRANAALTPTAARSTLGGTFIASPGTFVSGPIAANSGNVVLADWVNSTITGTYGTGYKVIAGIGSAINRTSPLRTFTGYSATSQPPVAENDTNSTNEDTALSVPANGVLANDHDPEGDPLTAAIATQPAHGTATVASDGAYTYTPDTNYNGTDSFTYRINDGHSNSAPATVTITVNAVNDAPVATAVTESTNEDTQKVVTLSASDVDGDTLAFSTTDPSHGTVSMPSVPDCTGTTCTTTVTYTPNANYNGADQFTFKANDGTTNSNVANVDLTVTSVNDAPVAVADAYGTDEDTQLVVAAPGVLGNDTDVEGDPLTAAIVTGPSHGSVTLNPDGSFTYTPTADYNGPDSFSYKANDGQADSAGEVTAVTINAVNDAPTAGAVTDSTPEDTAKAVTLTGTDVDDDALAFSIVTGPSHGSVGAIGTPDCSAVTTCTASVTYTPDANYAGNDSFTYKVHDGTVDSASATVMLTVSAVNDAPVADDNTYSTPEDTVLTITAPGVLGNDSDVEASALTANVVANVAHGTLTLDSDGSFSYTPDVNYHGPDSFTYKANDGSADSNVATVSITVDDVNDVPTAQTDSTTAAEDTPTSVGLSGTDADGDTLTFSIVTGPAHGSVGAPSAASCSGVVCNSDVTYTPDANYYGPDSFTYKTSDATASSPAATITVTVSAVNDAAQAGDDAYSTDEDTQLSVTAPGVLNNDSDVDSTITAALATGPSHGSLTLNPNGSFTYTPDANYNGSDSFTYTATDGSAPSAPATVTITVNAVNDAPTASPASATTNEDEPGAVTLSGSDVEGSALTFSIVTGPAHGSVGAIGVPSCSTGCTASVTYTPDANYNGTDSFTYKVNDGVADSSAATATVTVTAVNDAPVAGDDGAYQTIQNQNLSVTAPGVLNNDTDVDNATLAASNASDPDHGTVTLNANGSFSYDPDTGYTGPDSFTYDVSDGALTDSAIVSIVVVPPNATPTADAASASGNEDGGAITVTLTGHDADDDNLTFSPGTAANGLVSGPGTVDCTTTANVCTTTVTYTPGANFNGSDSFTYTVYDGTIASTPATASITVNPVNDAPSFTKGGDQTVLEDSGETTVAGWATSISAGPANESDQVVTFGASTNNDSLFSVLPAVSSAGTLTFTPAVNANGVATVTVQATDDGGIANSGNNQSPTQQFIITVTAVNDAPSFTKGADQEVFEDAGTQSVSNWVLAKSTGPSDESTQTLTFTVSNDNNALFTTPGQPAVSPTGTLTYTSAPNAVGTATVTVTLSDNGGGADTSPAQTFTILVKPVNDAPSFTTAGNQTVLEDAGAQTVNGFVTSASAGPANESGQTVTVAVTNHTNPSLFSSAPTVTNGVLTYTPAADANGSSTVTVQATDDGGVANGGVNTSPTQTFTIAVTSVNDAPTFTKGVDQTVNEDAGVQSVSNWVLAKSSGPSNESSQTLSFLVSNDNNGLFTTQPAVDPSGTLTFTGAPNQYGTATVTIAIKDNGGVANGGVDTSPGQTFTITVNPVNDAPVATAKAFTVQTNMKISLGGLLTGATDPNDSPVPAGQPAYTPSYTLGTITPGASCVGCTVSNMQPDGTFDFEPPAGGTGTYSVTYTVVDSGYPGPGATSAPQTITFTVSGPVIWFADALNGNDSNKGTLTSPFQTLAAVSGVDGTNHKVFLSPGTYSSAFTMTAGEMLAGAGTKAASFDALMGITPPAGTFARPSVSLATNPTVSGALTLGSGNTLRGVTLTAPTTALTGSAFGTLTLGDDSLSTTDVAVSTTGQALSLTNGTIDGDLLSVTSSGGSNNVQLSSVGTTGTSLGTGALSAATNDGFKVTGGAGTFTYSGTISNASSGAAVNIGSKTGGTITLSGAINDTSGAGVSLTSNAGATNNLTGGVTLSSGAANAFAATGGGTVSVTGSANTITSTVGTPVTITGTTIGASDVTFRSINANGAANGIVLSATGTSGNFVVTGNGGTCTLASPGACSGGTLANLTGADNSGTTPPGTGIVLNDTLAPSFTRMRINGSSNYGIRGSSVNGLTLDTVVVDGTNGTNGNAPFSESSLLFDNLIGTGSFPNLEVSGGTNGNIEVNNTSGTLNATFTALRLGSMSTTLGNDGLQVEGDGTATVNVTVQNSVFTSARGDQFQYIGNGTGGGTLSFTGNTLTNNHPAIATGGGGVTLVGGQDGPVTMTVSNNTIKDSLGNAYTIGKNPGSGSLTGTFSNNVIGVAGIANSGSLEGSGIRFAHQGTGTMTWNVTGNTIYQYNNYGILMQSGDGAIAGGNNNFNVSGNTIANPGTSNIGLWQGVLVNSGVTPGDSFQTCVNFGANTITGSGRNGGHDIRVRQRQATTVRLPGYGGTPGDTSAVAGFVVSKVGGSPTNSASADYPSGGGFIGTGTTC